MPGRIERIIVALVFAIAALLFSLWPQLDTSLSAMFYSPGEGFALDHLAIVQAVYWGVWYGSRIAIISVVLLWLAGFAMRGGWLESRRRWFGFLALAIAIGPGLITDAGLKNHWGRARPNQIQAFGGDKQFTPALLPSDQCDRNCSFVSGHATGAFAIMAFGWLAAPRRRARWLAGATLAGALVGLVRIVQGGHFLSDVIFAFLAVWLGCWLAAAILNRFGLLPRSDQLPVALR
ncbi:phosphatase PAP2 family protein [Niveibacterium umoris]|uniref:Lipid A 4'-phosphatase n=1 Tax=Niveibacterium umoris TaxID=1193620 RepID=A0A840BMV2_9RHOO|nr:phosphatase PAP2 family protein [Niveibacterium umoris]MBB4011817.1 lipid A 4'-phosphatase [Niveibacterium umoris]